jgi:signal transduction histidine kinase
MPTDHDWCHVTAPEATARLDRMELAKGTAEPLGRQSLLVRTGCVLMIAAAGMRAAFTALFEADRFPLPDYFAVQWSAGYALFVVAYALSSRSRTAARLRTPLLFLQSASALYLVWLYPNFLVTALLVVVAWQIAWSTTLRNALAAVAAQSLALAAMKCVDQVDGMPLLVFVSTCGFALFAVSAAHLARSEAGARESLTRANAELRAAHALLAESTRMTERLRISRDLHDVLGHNLTSMAVHLDVASRLAQGASVEHVQCARQLAGTLLDEVRDVVGQIRVHPVDLRASLRSLTEELPGLRVSLSLPDDLTPIDPARADAVLRCVQELITNTLRHAQARELSIEIRQSADGSVFIAARDDGRGGEVVEGHGLAGMRERFESLGGNLSVISAPDRGFGIQGHLPALGAAT